MSQSKRGLGKGLGALIGQTAQSQSPEAENALVLELDINKIEPNREQPRKYFDDDALMELAESFKQYGVIQPIIVKEEDGYYSIIAGERRWRAARLAKLSTIPAIVKDYTALDVLQIALIENIQRQDLNPIEEAMCYKRLVEEFFFTQEDVAAKVGKSRGSISNALSLLNLSGHVQNLLAEGKLAAGFARHLLAVKDADAQLALAEHIMEEDLSVREAEALVKAHLDQAAEPSEEKKAAPPAAKDSALTHLETDLRQIFGTKVHIRHNKNKGKIEIEYYSPEELERIIGLFKR